MARIGCARVSTTDQDLDVALVHRSFVNGLAIGRQDRNQLDPSAMPYKYNADRRHRIGR